jgi:hypothetical protein
MGRMDIEAFYDENPARRASEEFEFGRDWSDATGARCEVSWVRDTGELYVMVEPSEPIIPDGLGDEFLQRMPTELLTVDLLGVVPTRDALDQTLAGWPSAMPKPNSVAWIRERLAAGPSASTGGHPTAEREEPAELPGASDTSSFMVSTLIESLRNSLPESELAKLVPYERQAIQAGSDRTAEWHRAFACARWTEEIVALPAHHQLGSEARKAVQIVKEVADTAGWEMINLGRLPLGIGVSPRFEAELTWVTEAVHVAERVADTVGWQAVPWEKLLQDVLNVPAARQS